MEYFTKKAHIYLCCHGKYNRVSGMTQLESYLDHARKSICVNADPLMYLIFDSDFVAKIVDSFFADDFTSGDTLYKRHICYLKI